MVSETWGAGTLGDMQSKGHKDFRGTGNAIFTVTWVVIPWACLLISPYLLGTTYTPIPKN